MGDDTPNFGQAERRQSSSRDRGAPVAVGMVVAHPGIDEAGPGQHHVEKPLHRSRWPTGSAPEVANTCPLAGRKPDGRYFKEHEDNLYKSAERMPWHCPLLILHWALGILLPPLRVFCPGPASIQFLRFRWGVKNRDICWMLRIVRDEG